MVRIIREFSLEPATPDEPRTLLGIHREGIDGRESY
ncbi:MAG: hypothetical protein JRL30_14575 [Deltaproteobacteria bacterium]|nr:hypothetical protein [Deltaproteobacteria bacterium]